MNLPRVATKLTNYRGGHYEQLLDEILQRKLTARNITTYADDALEDLVALVEKIIANADQHDGSELTGLAKERQAIAAVGLDADMVERALTHIAGIAVRWGELDDIIAQKTVPVKRQLVPADKHRVQRIAPGAGSFKPKERIPKTKMLLLLLETEFDDIDVEGLPDFPAGECDKNGLRRTSYRLVQIPELERTVLVCDEAGNTTFVFDQAKCDGLGIAPDDIYGYTKDELKELISELQLGSQINYSEKYMDNLAAVLGGDVANLEDESQPSVHILTPKEVIETIPEGYTLFVELCKELPDVSENSLRTVMRQAKNVFAKRLYLKPQDSNHRLLLSPAQRAYLKEWYSEPEDCVTVSEIAAELGLSRTGVYCRITKIGLGKFGEVRVRHTPGSAGQPDRILNREQAAMLRAMGPNQRPRKTGTATLNAASRAIDS